MQWWPLGLVQVALLPLTMVGSEALQGMRNGQLSLHLHRLSDVFVTCHMASHASLVPSNSVKTTD